MSDAQHTIGKLIEAGQQRDAIHIALAPVVATQNLKPGEHIGFVRGSSTHVQAMGPHIGIVDPFLPEPVVTGQRFWMFLYPNTVTSLRHDWAHPAFPQDGRTFVPAGASDSERWLRQFAESVGLAYSVLMDGADTWLRSQGTKWGAEYLVLGGLLEGEYVPDEFWPHYEAVRGVKVPAEHKQSFFSCSC